jgi:hypothetical protein
MLPRRTLKEALYGPLCPSNEDALRIPANPTSDSDLKASTDSDAMHPVLETVRRWGEHHFRSGWLRSNSNLFSVETRII